MAKTKIPVLSLGAHGTIGDAITYQKRHSGTIVREKPIPAQPQTLPQIYQRWLYQDYIAWWHTLSSAEKQAWQSAAVRYHMSGFAYWMRTRLKNLPDLGGYWKLDERSGAVAHDSSKNLNHGTIFGATPATGIIGQCLSFDGLNDYVNCGNDPSLNPTTALTCEAFTWKSVSVDPVAEMILCKDSIADRSYFLGLNLPDGRVYFYVRGLVPFIVSALTAFNDSVWHHWAGVWDGTFLHIYKDGIQIQAVASAGTPNVSPAELWIGARSNNSNWLSGLIDHAKVYNRALTPSDIQRHSERSYP